MAQPSWRVVAFFIHQSLGAGSSGLAQLLRNQTPFPFLLCRPHDYQTASVLLSRISIFSAGTKRGRAKAESFVPAESALLLLFFIMLGYT